MRSIAQADAARNELVFQVHRAYYGVLQSRELVRIQQAAVESLEAALRAAQERLDAGAVVKTDVLNVEVQLAGAREGLARARNGEMLARSALANVVGDLSLRDAEFPEVTPAADLSIPDLEALDIADRPELRAADAGVEALNAQVVRSRRQYHPNLDLMANYDWNGEPFVDYEGSWFAGAALRWDAFDGFRRDSAIEAAEAQLAAAREQRRRVRLDLEHQLRQAVSTLREAIERVDVSRKSSRLAEESLRMTQQRYRNGAADITELLAAETALTAARSRAVSALYDRQVALAGVYRAVGRFAQETEMPVVDVAAAADGGSER